MRLFSRLVSKLVNPNAEFACIYTSLTYDLARRLEKEWIDLVTENLFYMLPALICGEHYLIISSYAN